MVAWLPAKPEAEKEGYCGESDTDKIEKEHNF